MTAPLPPADPRPRLSRRAALSLLLAGCATPAPGAAMLEPLGEIQPDLGSGGWSGLEMDGALACTAISDRGRWARFTLRLDAALRPTGIDGLRHGPLRDGGGRPLVPGWAGDAESLARLPDGRFVVGFERWHRLRAYADFDGPGLPFAAPPGLEKAPLNAGLEALATLPDGRLIGIAEGLSPPGRAELRQAWIGGPGRWQDAAWEPSGPGLDPTEVRALPDGGLLVLERGFSVFTGFRGAISLVPAAAVAPGAVLRGRRLLLLDADNWEAMAVARHGEALLVAVMTDDNEMWWQRSRLALYRLAG
jgi:hypothetical protein